MRIPAIDLHGQHERLREELVQTFTRVVASSAFINGPEVKAFEGEFAAYCEVGHAVGVGSGTDALALALRALGIGARDAVALPAFTFAATAEAVCHVGARPVLIDIEPQTFALDPECLHRAVRVHQGSLRAVIAVHLYGQPAPMDEIAAVAAEADLAIIEDAAQAHGARYRGRRVGGLGNAGCFSFYPTKNLGALGDAGAVTTNDGNIADRIAVLRDHGQNRKYVHDIVGFNSRLDALQAAALRVKLRHLDGWNARRQALAARYRAELAGVPEVAVPTPAADREHVYHLFVIRCRERDVLREHLEARGIASSVHYPLPLHFQPAFAHLGRRGDLPVAEAAADEVLALPLYPELADDAVTEVCDAIREWAVTRP
jgi:dTDP-4-amino-4,6-dideoxygalactose transaminase